MSDDDVYGEAAGAEEAESMTDITDEIVDAAAAAMMAPRTWDELPSDLHVFWRSEARKVLEAALAGRTVLDNPDTVDLRQFDPTQLNALAAAIEEPHGFLPTTIRFGAAAAALRYVEVHWPASGVAGGAPKAGAEQITYCDDPDCDGHGREDW